MAKQPISVRARFGVALPVLLVLILGTGTARASVTCTATFALQDAKTLGALQFDVDYSATDGGSFVGSANQVQCSSLLNSAFSAFNDVDASHLFRAGIADYSFSGVTGPKSIAQCTFKAASTPQPGDFVITTKDAAPPETSDSQSNVCGAPATGANPPFASDALVAARAAVGLEGCSSCECDVNSSGSVTSSDSLLILRKAVGQSGTLTCASCGGAPVFSAPSTNATVTVSLDCAVDQVCGDGSVTGIEECDDGNVDSGDCCSSTCQSETGSPCDDDDSNCTNDFCDGAGFCVHQPVGQGIVCRESVDVCDTEEVCDGITGACPADVFASSTSICRNASNGCDFAERCTGFDASCPSDLKKGSGAPCGSTNESPCDHADTCDGFGLCLSNVEADGASCDDDTCTSDRCSIGECLVDQIPDCPLVPADQAVGEEFGAAVALTQEYLVVGAPGSQTPSAGRVHLFRSTESGYSEQTQAGPIPIPFEDSNQTNEDEDFGAAVDVDQNTIVVGAPFDVVAVGDKQSHGSASVFFFNGTAWVQQAKLLDTTGLCTKLGTDVAISANTVVLGAPGGDCALVFQRAGTQWALASTLKSASTNVRFGQSVDISGDSILVGAPGALTGSGCSSNGSVFAFRRAGAQWNLEETIDQPDGGGEHSCFGIAVAVDGANGVVGAPQDDSVANNAGAAYIVERDGEAWSITEQLLASPDSKAGDGFGASVDIRKDVLIVGATGVAAYLFQLDADATTSSVRFIQNKWEQRKIYTPPQDTPGTLSKFAFSVAVTPGQAAAGAPGEDPNGIEDAGAVYPSDSAPVPVFVCGNSTVTADEDCDDGDTTWKTGQHCNASCHALGCGDPNDSHTITTADALFALKTAVKVATCDLLVCDVNKNGSVTTSDALAILKKSVNVPVTLKCS